MNRKEFTLNSLTVEQGADERHTMQYVFREMKTMRENRYSAWLELSSCLTPFCSHRYSQGVLLIVGLCFLLLKYCCSADTFHSDVVCS